MRVLVATAELTPVTSVGGLGEAVAGLVGALRARGVSVDLVVPDYAPTRDATRRRLAPSHRRAGLGGAGVGADR